MTLMLVIAGLFWKDKARPSHISIAISEGIKDMFGEMGYRFKDKPEV